MEVSRANELSAARDDLRKLMHDEFEVAGIISSVAIELAVNYFHVQGPFQFAAVPLPGPVSFEWLITM